MYRLLTTVSARELRQSPLRTSLVVCGIAAGVALLAGIHVVNRAVTDHLRESAGALAGHANLQVIAPGGERNHRPNGSHLPRAQILSLPRTHTETSPTRSHQAIHSTNPQHQ